MIITVMLDMAVCLLNAVTLVMVIVAMRWIDEAMQGEEEETPGEMRWEDIHRKVTQWH